MCREASRVHFYAAGVKTGCVADGTTVCRVLPVSKWSGCGVRRDCRLVLHGLRVHSRVLRVRWCVREIYLPCSTAIFAVVLIVRMLDVIIHGMSYDVCIVWVFMRDFYTLIRVLSCMCMSSS